ncbi:GPI inositol-deacylase [Acinetobacter bohemicus]|uniref:PGAP1-like alpha/beta domain-containing protein n=1 Tax=Acinetobacter sp. S4397-1 TaxID=2972915 RepID=UPI00209B6E68|nr:alpha/beta hydrolase [Acinetobacter sp. S4397-1]MCO8045174.1 GPI inositol-deacylase [Acinetobacter sp. S4397-1]MDM1781849.1 alpha/beta hydrolase [Acinetobacter indicus]
MPSLTPLHETYCRWDRTPPSQADVLEGLAQLVTMRLNDVAQELIKTIQREILLSMFGLSDQNAKSLQNIPYIARLYQSSYDMIFHYGNTLIAPGLRQIIEHFPKLHHRPLTPTLHFLVSALNGIIGDYLIKHQNPLALPMLIYDHYGSLQQGELTGRISLFVHGLCMNHLDWSNHKYEGIGEKLLAQRDRNTMLYLHYNTGRRISANGHSLANTLQELVQCNPGITSIDLIGHSMGGLVSRSALFYGKQNVHDWIPMVENLVCLGSPHHGAVLERFGFNLQDKLGHFPLVKIVGHLVNIRSNGILDLRYGSVRDDDWEHNPVRIGFMDDNRKPAPIPSHIDAYLVAGTIELEKRKNKTRNVIGDYLVSVKSALGEHPNPRYDLKVPDAHKAIFYGLNHFEIQYHPLVAEQIARWFYPSVEDENCTQIYQHLVDLNSIEGIALT